MSTSPNLSNLLAKKKGAVTAAFLLVLLVAALPFSASNATVSQVSSQAQSAEIVGSSGSAPLSTEQSVQTTATLSVAPNPVGVGQRILIQGFVEPVPPSSTDRLTGLVISVVKPDGTRDILGPIISGPSGWVFVYYVVDQVGTHRLWSNYSGQFFSNYNLTYLPAQSPVISLTVQQNPAQHRLWTVDDDGSADFSSIANAVSVANAGDFVFVRSGMYKEAQVTVRKPLTLAGEDKTTVILDGDDGKGGIYGARIYVQNASDVVVRGFTVRKGGGIYSAFSNNTIITQNIITGCPQGIILISAINNTISKNIVTNCSMAIVLGSGSQSSAISENIVTSNDGEAIFVSQSNKNSVIGNYVAANGLGTQPGYHVYGIRLSYSNSNTVYHNDLIGNYEQADGWNSYNNTWDNGYRSGGNYWSDYEGQDANHDGVGDTPYTIDANNTDRYPLMSPFKLGVPSVQTTISMNVLPNPVSIGNWVTLDVTVEPRPPTSNDSFTGLMFSITRPDGEIHMLGPFSSDSDGRLRTFYWADQVGNYRVQLTYARQLFLSRSISYLPVQSFVTTFSALPDVVPRRWIVDDDGPADFHTIQNAINAAQNGDWVQVMDGSYFENLSIDKSITLQGQNPKLTILNGGIMIWTSGVVIDSLRLVGSGRWAQLHTYNYGVTTITNQTLWSGQRQDVWETVISNCTFDNWVIAIMLMGGEGGKVINNTISNSDNGIDLDTCDNKILNNKINVGSWGICVGEEYISGNYLYGNEISGGLGVEINWFNRNNTVEGNTISNCRYGIHLGAYSEGYGPCSENIIFHNNFLNNVEQVFLGSGSTDTWDSGYPSGGNYWSDYNGTDANHDGIGDTPYVIDANNVDRYPLMSTLNVTPTNKTDNNISSTLVPSEKPTEVQHATDATGNSTDLTVPDRPVPGGTNNSGKTPINVELNPEPAPNLLTVFVVAGILVAPLMVTIYLAKKNTSQDKLKSQDVANG